MPSQADLRHTLQRLDRKNYRAYRGIEGAYRFPQFTLFIDHAQSDPFAPPSRMRVRMLLQEASYPPEIVSGRGRRVSLADFLARAFRATLRRLELRPMAIDAGGQEVLERTAAEVTGEHVELRLTARLPAAGRSILGNEAAHLLVDQLGRAVLETLPWQQVRQEQAWRHVHTVEDAQALRAALPERGLVAFVADGAVLPRLSGASDLPLREHVIPFESPAELRLALQAPHAGEVTGMGIRRGVTLIVGGGYHGKSTLLQALQVGIYDHVPGDGRERVVTAPNAVKVRSEDGRAVQQVDISPFLNNLPFDVDTTAFSTEDASGSTSQAAAIMEALEVGTSLLLLDEDTSATNFMVRDELMQRLVPKELEPITPFIDRLPELRERGVSSIIVVGGDGDYFEVADSVIMMQAYHPRDVTARARSIAAGRQDARRRELETPFTPPIPRIPLPHSIDAETRQGRVKVRARDVEEIRFGREEIQLGTVDQLVDLSQTRAIGAILLFLVRSGILDGRRTLREALTVLAGEVERRGLAGVTAAGGSPPGDLALPRIHEVAAAINRLRTLCVRQARD